MLIRRIRIFNHMRNRMIRYGHDSHGPPMPPFARLQPPTSTLPEQIELVWDDSVAPETCIDFDAPSVSTSQVLLSFGAGMSFFLVVYLLVSISDPEKSNPVAKRSRILSESTLNHGLGIETTSNGDAEEDESEE